MTGIVQILEGKNSSEIIEPGERKTNVQTKEGWLLCLLPIMILDVGRQPHILADKIKSKNKMFRVNLKYF